MSRRIRAALSYTLYGYFARKRREWSDAQKPVFEQPTDPGTVTRVTYKTLDDPLLFMLDNQGRWHDLVAEWDTTTITCVPWTSITDDVTEVEVLHAP